MQGDDGADPGGPARPSVRCIEVIGSSGVGKSTLLAALLRERERTARWWTSSEALGGGPRRQLDARRRDDYLALLPSAAHASQRSVNVRGAVNLLRFFAGLIDEDAKLFATELDAVVVKDEGLAQNFSGILTEWAQDDPDRFGRIVEQRAVLVVSAPLDLVVERVLARRGNGDARPLQDPLDVEALEREYQRGAEYRERLVDALAAVGRPVGRVDVRAPIGEVRAEVDRLVEALGGGEPAPRRGRLRRPRR